MYGTTFMTPLNPFLAIEVLLRSNTYQAQVFTGADAFWLREFWLGRPIAAFIWVCVLISLGMVVFSTIRLRIIGAKVGAVPWYRRVLNLGA